MHACMCGMQNNPSVIVTVVEPSNVSSEVAAEVASLIFNNREFVMVLTTSIAMFIGCVVLLIWQRLGGSKPKTFEPLKQVPVKQQEIEENNGNEKGTIFFDIQTGTVEGFVKALAEQAEARYNKTTFKVMDLDDYANDDDLQTMMIMQRTVVHACMHDVLVQRVHGWHCHYAHILPVGAEHVDGANILEPATCHAREHEIE